MSRVLLGAALVLAASFALVGGALAAPPLIARATLSPAGVRFGDEVVARIDVQVDSSRLEPDTVRLVPQFAPYTSRGAPLRQGLRFRYLLACVSDACLPGRKGRVFRLPVGRVEAVTKDGRRVSAPVAWPPLRVVSRVSEADRTKPTPPWRTAFGLPGLTYRVAPSTLETALYAAAALLTLAAGVGLARHRIGTVLPPSGRRLSPLERALRLTRESVGRSDRDRRKALDLLSRELRRTDERGLGGEARGLAWSREQPSGARVEELAREVERSEVSP